MRLKDDREISKVPLDLLPPFLEVEDGPAQAWTEDGVRYETIQIGQPGATEAELISEWLREIERKAAGKTKVIFRIRPEIWRTKKMNQIYSRQVFV